MTTNGWKGRQIGETMSKAEGDRIADEVLRLVQHIAAMEIGEPAAPGPPPCPRCGFAGGPVSAESVERTRQSESDPVRVAQRLAESHRD